MSGRWDAREVAVTIAHSRSTRRAVLASATLAIAMLFGAASLSEAASPRAIPPGGTQLLMGGLDQPVFATNAGDSRLFIVERTGRIVIAKQVSGNWQITGTFLDIRAKVDSNGGEQGLLGLAFPHDYKSSGLFYVYYVGKGANEVIAEYHRATKSRADASSERRLLTIWDPYDNHNGGWIAFRPGQPYLYAVDGDGGSGGDPQNHAQNLKSLLGKLIRIDPRDPDGSGPKTYGIPKSNPFVGKPGRDEIYAYGLRNPWRDSFDSVTGDLWIGDVGQDSYEEIDHVKTGSGLNFGWNKVEGLHLYPSGALCHTNCHTLPVIEYSHSYGCAVVGGYVSRRPGAALAGQYLFGDNCSGSIWRVPTSFHGTNLPTPYASGLSISSFGQGHDGRLYVLDLGGSLYSVVGS
jgi:glucose/arabinose dehydrogenase